MTSIRQAKIAELVPDPQNANKGTERGAEMVRRSLERLGAGRSVLVDKHGVLIAGNKTTEAAADIGLEDAIIVLTDGSKLVVVQRTDLDLATDAEAKELAIADNRSAEVGLSWEVPILQEIAEDIDLGDWFTEDEQHDWTWQKGATSRFGAGEDDDDVPSIMDGGFPLAIVLSPAELKEWNIVKESVGASSDKALLLMLMRGEV